MEEWRILVNFPTYEVNRFGIVRNKVSKRNKVFTDNGHGYLRTNLFVNGRQVTTYLHRLIAEAFIDNPYNLPEINHKDGNKLNNTVDNLEWCDGSYNSLHKHYVLKHGNCKSVQCVETKIVYPSIMVAERKNGCDHRHISDCCRGVRQTCGGYHWRYV